jgi:hypothetical protein
MIELAKVLYGSQNYGLDGEDSDRDYKLVLCPGFDELYEGKMCKKNEGEHVVGIDLRRLHGLLVDGNPNAVELLYSVDVELIDGDWVGKYFDCWRRVYENGYLAAVWRTFYAALTGIALNGIDRNGVTPKTVARAFYFLGMAKHLAWNGFVMNEGVYRDEGLEFHRLARKIRFEPPGNEGVLIGIAEYVKRGFEAWKAEVQNRADAACEGHDWAKVVDGMDGMVRMIVRERGVLCERVGVV